jgi:hypothetical protein
MPLRLARYLTTALFVGLAVLLGLQTAVAMNTGGQAFKELMVDDTFWMSVMPFMYHAGLLVAAVCLLWRRPLTNVALFLIAAMTIEEVLMGFISSTAVPFSITAKLGLSLASLAALGWAFQYQKENPDSKGVGLRILITGILLAATSSLLYEMLAGVHAAAYRDGTIAVLLAGVTLAGGLTSRWIRFYLPMPALAYAFIRRAHRPVVWSAFLALLGWNLWLLTGPVDRGLLLALAGLIGLTGLIAGHRLPLATEQAVPAATED